MNPRKSDITETTFSDIVRTMVRIFSISTKVTCGHEFARIPCFHFSVSAAYAETKYVFGAVRKASGSNEK
jgi:GTP cyclohydrolase I